MASTAGAAARSILRSCSGRRAAFRLGSEAKGGRSRFGVASNKPLSQSTLRRCPVELSFCVESMLPYHMATASALMTSMLSVSRRSYGWLPEGIVSASTALVYQVFLLEERGNVEDFLQLMLRKNNWDYGEYCYVLPHFGSPSLPREDYLKIKKQGWDDMDLF
ncbi:hypothetical protein V8G54_026792 [Vigna mungo]|uniref:Protein NUCLEAR FUSION DEFECTIVE 6, chloroplastic/mitochondrial n=1 Tax=Vigna mungo TaxID=3915 RepID=A0AAQ3RPT6_VIGMU